MQRRRHRLLKRHWLLKRHRLRWRLALRRPLKRSRSGADPALAPALKHFAQREAFDAAAARLGIAAPLADRLWDALPL